MVWRVILIPLLVLHGAVHVLGFVVPWQLAEPQGLPYKETLLDGHLHAGAGGVRAVGVAYLIAGAALVVAAIALLAGQTWWWGLAVTGTGLSLAVTFLTLPEAKVGLALNVVVLGVLLLASQTRELATG